MFQIKHSGMNRTLHRRAGMLMFLDDTCNENATPIIYPTLKEAELAVGSLRYDPEIIIEQL